MTDKYKFEDFNTLKGIDTTLALKHLFARVEALEAGNEDADQDRAALGLVGLIRHTMKAHEATTLEEAPPGPFMFKSQSGALLFGFKSEYRTAIETPDGTFWQIDAYNSGGEYFWGGVSDREERHRLFVTPLTIELEIPTDGE